MYLKFFLSSRFAIIFWEDLQIDFAEENVTLKLSLRPPPPSACTLHFKTDNQFKIRQLAVKDNVSSQALACVMQMAFIGSWERHFTDQH